MNEIYINIIILGLDIKTTLELKSELRRIIPRKIHLNWIYTLDENIDLIIVGDSIFDTHTIQRFIKQRETGFLSERMINYTCDHFSCQTIRSCTYLMQIKRFINDTRNSRACKNRISKNNVRSS